MKTNGSAVIQALRFDRTDDPLAGLADEEWRAVLAWCDRYQLTLTLARAITDCPQWVKDRLDGNAAASRIRFGKLIHLHRSLRGFDHLVLKGFAHWPYFSPDPELRTQYDLDLYCPREVVMHARDVALSLGYETLRGLDGFPTDHLPAMIRKTGWQWRGDFFDTEIPFSLELHFRFWDAATERFGPPDLEGFWERREQREWGGVGFTSLCEADSLGYACLHALRHLLRGDSRPHQIYEIAWFLQRQQDPAFWSKWKTLHSDSLRRIEAICFRFGEEWFGCRMAAEARAEVDALAPAVQAWFERWARSPLESGSHPNKDELWLHMSLLESTPDKLAVLRRRLIPWKPPGAMDAVHVPDEQITWRLRVRRVWRYCQFTSSRFLHHALLLIPTVITGLRWWLVQRGLPPDYWKFFSAAVVYNLALMIFYLLYNLYLLSLGYREDFVGKVTAAMTAGSVVGSMIVGVVASRIGLRASLVFCFVSVGAACALRVLAVNALALLAFAFLGGVCQSFWAVCLSPAVAAMTNERNRPFAFSLTFSMGVGLGMVTGVVGGRLPAVLHSMQNALWLACGLAPLAVLPILRLRLGSPIATNARTLAMNPFLMRFMGALALWGLATGAFNPFFSTFFARSQHLSVERIGVIFSVAQMAQVVAMLLSPLVLRRFGLGPGIAMMQAATGIALAGLGFSTPALVGSVYVLYMAFQYMSEPGIYSMLMDRLPPDQRTGASALNFVVLFGTQALAAWASGAAIARFGYPPVLLAAAAVALLAARAITFVTRSR